MSFTVYLQKYRNGEIVGIDVGEIAGCFTGELKKAKHGGYDVQYDGLNEAWVNFNDTGTVGDISVHRPCGIQLFKDLFKILNLGFICYWSDSGCIYSSIQVNEDDLPDGMVDAIGPVILLKDEADFCSKIT